MWHVVCGDVAAAVVAPLVAAQEGRSQVRVLRDDLAVGPLGDVSGPDCRERAAFWRTVWPEEDTSAPDFEAGLRDDAAWLASMASQGEAVTVWHGDSASEQLMLARVAAAVRNAGRVFHEVNCGTGESQTGRRRAVGMCAPDLLASFQKEPVSPERCMALAEAWQQQVAADHLLRRWHQGQFAGGGFEDVDAALKAACNVDERPLARVMAEVMQQAVGYFPTDYFLYWRARELAARGSILLTGDRQGNYPALSARRA